MGEKQDLKKHRIKNMRISGKENHICLKWMVNQKQITLKDTIDIHRKPC